MPADPFYNSPYWKQIRSVILERDDYRCAVPGCLEPASVVDHIKARRDGGDENLKNLRSLCRTHDIQVRQNVSGFRNRQGQLPSVCDTKGMPTNPAHPWFRK